MPEVPKGRAGRVADPMGDEGPAALAFGAGHRPGRFVFIRVGAFFALRVDKFHFRCGGKVRQPHVRRENVAGRRVPAAIITRGSIGKIGHARVVEPSLSKRFPGDRADQDLRVLQVGAAHRVDDATASSYRRAVIIRTHAMVRISV